jgi:hypothetical protein
MLEKRNTMDTFAKKIQTTKLGVCGVITLYFRGSRALVGSGLFTVKAS